MNIYLYKTADEANRLEKTLSGEIALTGSLREECDILSPEIKIVRTRRWEITAEVVPLMSYADKIKALPAIAGRSANNINYYISDGKQEVLSQARVQTKLFPKGFSGATYVLTTAGGN